ncbi:MAG: LuxR C-terminal-related transcriptional regulator, partial [Thermomicrobiales bacterium]
LDGLPLAIELAAARVRIFSLAELQDRLDEQIDILGGGPRDQPEHQRTMRATIAWSYALLTPAEKDALRVLAWFDTPFSQDAGLALLRDAGRGDDAEVSALIASLVDHHLLRVLPTPDGARYLMFLTIRVFGRELSRGLGEESRRRDAHAAWIASYAIASLALRPDGTIASKNLVALDQSYPDIERALLWYEQQGRHDALLGLVIALSPYWTHRFGRAEGRRWVERALALAPSSASEAMLARAELELAALCRTSRTGDPIDAIQIARQSLERFQRLHDPLGILAALNTIGVLHRAQGALDEAKTAFEAALAQTADLDVPWWQSLVLCNLGATALWRGETRDARHRLEEALRGFRDLSDRRGIAFTLHVLALVRCAQGDARTAAALTIEGLDEARTVEALETSIDLIAAAGVVAAAGGEFAPAIRLLEGAHTLSERAMYRIERPEREVYDDWERIARRAMGPLQAEHPPDVDAMVTLDDLVQVARTELRRVATGAPSPQATATSSGVEAAGHELTVREHQVLALMAQRYTDREIAETLQISVRTVSRHVSNIFAKLGLRSRRDVLGRASINPDGPDEP